MIELSRSAAHAALRSASSTLEGQSPPSACATAPAASQPNSVELGLMKKYHPASTRTPITITLRTGPRHHRTLIVWGCSPNETRVGESRSLGRLTEEVLHRRHARKRWRPDGGCRCWWPRHDSMSSSPDTSAQLDGAGRPPPHRRLRRSPRSPPAAVAPPRPRDPAAVPGSPRRRNPV